MRALRVHKFAEAQVPLLLDDVPVPTISPSQVSYPTQF